MSKLNKLWAKKIRRMDRILGNVDRPERADDHIWITNGGKRYHPCWCSVINGIWLSGSNALRAITVAEAKRRLLVICQRCDSGEFIP